MNTTLDGLDDLALVRRYLDGNDAEALGALFERHASLAYRMAFRVMRNASDAEEAVQEAFADMVRALPRYRGGAGFKVWLVKAVVGTCKMKIRSHVRRRQREERYSLDREIMAVNADEGEDRTAEMAEATRKILDTLPDLYRLPIWMHYGENMPFQAVAAALASTENTVKSRARRGLELLRNRLARAGLSVSAASVAGVLPLLPMDSAPHSLTEWIRNFTRQAASVPPEPLRATGKTRGIRLAVAATTVAAAGGALLWLDPMSVRSVKNGGPPLRSEKAAFYWHCDFNTPDSTNLFTTALGAFRHVPDGGPDGSGCLETVEEDTVIDVHVPIETLPVRVSYRQAPILPQPVGAFAAFTFWSHYEFCARFEGIGEMRRDLLSRGQSLLWSSASDYVAADAIDRWVDGRRTGYFAIRRAPHALLRLKFRGRHRLDDLTIQSVSPEDLPDTSVFAHALDSIPPDKRTGAVALPELKPGPTHKSVSVFFRPPRL